MKRRKPPFDPHSNPWRWNLGGPITEFEEQGIEAGPSSFSSTSWQQHQDDDYAAAAAEGLLQGAVRPRRRRHQQRRHIPYLACAAAAAAISVLPHAFAGPLPPSSLLSPPTLPEPTRTLRSTITTTTTTATATTNPYPTLAERRLSTPVEYEAPSTVPVTEKSAVPETALPLYLTQDSEGGWHKVPNAWSLYGRTASADANAAQPTNGVNSYIIQSSLPAGWGNKSAEHTYFYNTPLIVAASVVLGILIVFAIVIYTYQRRKTARRRKRHAARMRRKALAAAGLTEDTLKAADAEHEEKFKQRLAELEVQHAAKRKVQKKQSTKSSIVRTKVRTWRGGVRRRTTSKSKREAEDTLNKEISPSSSNAYATAVEVRPRTSQESLLTRDSVSLATTRSSLSRGPSRSSFHARSRSSPPTTDPAELSDRVVSGGSTTALDSSDAAPRAGSPDSRQPSEEPVQPVASGSMPPAYRPASVHAIEAGPSSASGPSSAQNQSVPAVLSTEKSAAEGYYTAPATEDAESAQAVARIADAKAPITIPPTIDEDRQMHVATDDKGALERMRLAASAPPVHRAADDGEGPSAPSFDVDESGFERVPEDLEMASSSPVRTAVPGLPEPPQIRAIRSPMEPSAPSMPSAPPAPSAPSAPPAEPSAPSAPPLDDQPEASAPSAPPLEEDDDDLYDTEYHASASASGSNGSGGSGGSSEEHAEDGELRASLNVGGHGFLPRYEP